MPRHIARIIASPPAADRWTMRATLPLPVGYRAHANAPFTVHAQDGSRSEGHPLRTQWEIVSLYPSIPGDGADRNVAVCEVLAHVPRELAGTRKFDVLAQPSEPDIVSPHPRVVDLVGGFGQILLRARDAASDPYLASLSTKIEPPLAREVVGYDRDWPRWGSCMVTRARRGVLKAPAGTIGAHPFFGGFHAYLSVEHGSDVVALTLNFHNAVAPAWGGRPIGDLHLESLELGLPRGWTMLPEWPEPMLGAVVEDDGGPVVWHSLIPAARSAPTPPASAGAEAEREVAQRYPSNSTGGWLADVDHFHLIPPRAQRTWRLVLHEEGNEKAARIVARLQGLGTAQDGDQDVECYPLGDAEEPSKLYGWANPRTANYLAQRVGVPQLHHRGASAYDEDALEGLNRSAAEGRPHPFGHVEGFPMGPWNPLGVRYGGMTGGLGIEHFPGVGALREYGSAGTRAHRQRAARTLQRHPVAIWTEFGEAPRVERALRDGKAAWALYDGRFLKNPPADEPYGFSNFDEARARDVRAAGKVAPYAEALEGFQPIDFQHLTRATADLRALIWNENDPWAKDQLELLAEIGRHYLHGYPATGRGAPGHLARVRTEPESHGAALGRGEAWIVDAAANWYAVAPAGRRRELYPWFEEVAQTYQRAQMPNGFFQSNRDGKGATWPPFSRYPEDPDQVYPFQGPRDPVHRVACAVEHHITLHALAGVLQSVFAFDQLPIVSPYLSEGPSADVPRSEIRKSDGEHRRSVLLAQAIADGATASWEYAWNRERRGVWFQIAVGPYARNSAPYDFRDERPGWTGDISTELGGAGVDAHDFASAMSAGWLAAGMLKEEDRDHARHMIDLAVEEWSAAKLLETTVLGAMMADGSKDLRYRAGLLWLAQTGAFDEDGEAE